MSIFLENDGFHNLIDSKNQHPPDLNLLNWRCDNILRPNEKKIFGSKVLDFGSHNGQWIYASLKLGAQSAIGIEKEQKYIDVAEQNMKRTSFKNYKFIRGDIEKEVFSGFDFIICMNVLYFISDLDLFFSKLNFKNMIIDTFLNHGTVKSKYWLEKKMKKYMYFREFNFNNSPAHYSQKAVYYCCQKIF